MAATTTTAPNGEGSGSGDDPLTGGTTVPANSTGEKEWWPIPVLLMAVSAIVILLLVFKKREP